MRYTLAFFFLIQSYANAAKICKISLIEKLVKVGIPNNSKTVGFHGTNLHALQLAAETGRLPTGSAEDSTAGYIYFFPNPENPQLQKASVKLFGSDLASLDDSFFEKSQQSQKRTAMAAFMGAKGYAQTHAENAYIARNFGLKTITEIRNIYEDIRRVAVFGDSQSKNLKKHGFSDNQIREFFQTLTTMDKTRSEISFVISFDPKILKDLPVSTAAEGDSGFRIHAPDGIPVEYISGIEVITDYNSTSYTSFEEWLKSLRK